MIISLKYSRTGLFILFILKWIILRTNNGYLAGRIIADIGNLIIIFLE